MRYPAPTHVPTTVPTDSPITISTPPPIPALTPGPTVAEAGQLRVLITAPVVSSSADGGGATFAVVEPSVRIVLTASVETQSSGAMASIAAVEWWCDTLDVRDATMFSTPSNLLTLVARAGALRAGQRYTFGFSAVTAVGIVAHAANVTVVGNRPPSGGWLEVSPRTGGVALRTRFMLASVGWVGGSLDDADDGDGDGSGGALSHRFAFVSSSSAGVVVTLEDSSGSYAVSPTASSSGDGEGDDGRNATWTAITMLPIGNLTLVVTVTDSLGGTGTARVHNVVVVGGDAVAAVRNATSLITSLNAAGDAMAALSLVATAAETLSVAALVDDNGGTNGGTDRAARTAARSVLLTLARNSSSGRLTVMAAKGTTDDNDTPVAPSVNDDATTLVGLRAVALELIVSVPDEIDDATATAAVRFAGDIANSSRVLGGISPAARSALVASLSSVVDAGYLHRSPAAVTAMATETEDGEAVRTAATWRAAAVSDVLRRVHLLSLSQLAPAEDALVDQAPSLALSTSKAGCSINGCSGASAMLDVSSVRLFSADKTDGTSVRAMVRSETVSEVLLALARGDNNCASIFGGDDAVAEGEVGLQAVAWRRNPWPASSSAPASIVASATAGGGWLFDAVGENKTVLSVTLSSCGRSLDVANVSTPILLELPIAVPSLSPSSSSSFSSSSLSAWDELVQDLMVYDEFFSGSCDGDMEAEAPHISSTVPLSTLPSPAPTKTSSSSAKSLLVRCNTSGALLNVTCPVGAVTWNVTCPPLNATRTCLFYDHTRAAWSERGVGVASHDASMLFAPSEGSSTSLHDDDDTVVVRCETTHLSEFAEVRDGHSATV